jgi:hypothetical protein
MISATSVGIQYDVAMEEKVQASVRQEGQEAMKLIESAAVAPPPPEPAAKLAASGDVGTKLHTVA